MVSRGRPAVGRTRPYLHRTEGEFNGLWGSAKILIDQL
jgi:hypothetical protein